MLLCMVSQRAESTYCFRPHLCAGQRHKNTGGEINWEPANSHSCEKYPFKLCVRVLVSKKVQSPKQSKHWKSATFQNRSIFCYKHQIVRNCNMTIFLLRPKSSTTQLYFQQWENFTVNTCLFSFSSTIEILQRLRRHCYLQSTNGNTEASDEITW